MVAVNDWPMEFDNIPGRILWYPRVKTKEPTLELGIVFGCDMYGVRVHMLIMEIPPSNELFNVTVARPDSPCRGIFGVCNNANHSGK